MSFLLSRRAAFGAGMASVLALTLRPNPSIAADGQPVVSLRSGRVRGTRAAGVASFRRIPYAANPFTAATRFQAPQPAGPWEGIRDATAFGPPPPQPSRDPKPVLFGGPDDLTLNIWTPDPAAGGLPVMVWIPGGAFVRADAGEPVYDGTRFAAAGIVVVTVNYRVGVDGFMAIDGAPANRGLLDQIAALNWVRDNIAAFGGDAANVTLFGQSAGAESVAILLASPKTEGLFKRAILQSPPMQAMTSADASRLAGVFAQGLGVAPTVAGLGGVPFDALIAAGPGLAAELKDGAKWGKLSLGGTAFLPVVDGDVLDASPIDMLARGPKPGVPAIVGSTDQEARLYMVPGGAIDHISQQAIDQFVSDLHLPANTSDIYRADPANATTGDLFTALQSDYTFRMPALRIAELRSGNRQTWHYNFSWRSPGYGGRLGAAHFVDVPFSFDALSSNQAKTFAGPNPPASLAEAMHGAWVAFAKTGNPGWPAYDLAARTTKRFDATSSLVNDPEKATRDLWRDVAF
ncbi:carboxylesterase/lipase family protein [Nitrospirillum sp. BR 11828]|uniref:carboxylesterase/lipase family protein n=1 Tax=Nitrospirillum sp. BR 11828 TaxID=3104325 RepID=UPI002ACAB35A|nr:carboxylesterase family protein [Nitrospirillum sp. BR 11828]MDZ5650277.1 carboxylesterase family protein [Nitrospirillum sp. BR 11828]